MPQTSCEPPPTTFSAMKLEHNTHVTDCTADQYCCYVVVVETLGNPHNFEGFVVENVWQALAAARHVWGIDKAQKQVEVMTSLLMATGLTWVLQLPIVHTMSHNKCTGSAVREA